MSRAFARLTDLQLFPIAVAQCSIAWLGLDADWERELGIELPESLAVAAPKRRRDYLAGRYCARQALSQLDPELARSPIEIGAAREPVWPEGIVGSITHTDGFASAVAARASDVTGLGVDAEREPPSSDLAHLEHQIVSPVEADALKASDLPRSTRTLLAFSAKEAIFKCFYPRARQLWEFHEVEIVRIDPERGSFLARGASSRAAAIWPRLGVDGRFLIRDGRVYTGACVRTPPASV
jgi:enterobactin synthetase component D